MPGPSLLQVQELEEVVHERDAMAVRLGMLEARLDETRAERGQVRASGVLALCLPPAALRFAVQGLPCQEMQAERVPSSDPGTLSAFGQLGCFLRGRAAGGAAGACAPWSP